MRWHHLLFAYQVCQQDIGDEIQISDNQQIFVLSIFHENDSNIDYVDFQFGMSPDSISGACNVIVILKTQTFYICATTIMFEHNSTR